MKTAWDVWLNFLYGFLLTTPAKNTLRKKIKKFPALFSDVTHCVYFGRVGVFALDLDGVEEHHSVEIKIKRYKCNFFCFEKFPFAVHRRYKKSFAGS